MSDRNRSTLNRLLTALAIIGTFVAAQFLLVERIRPREMTITAMGETAARIQLYFQANNRLPVDLSVLPLRQGYPNSVVDGRNRRLKYTVTAGNSFTLCTATLTSDADACRKYTIVNGKIVWPP